MQNNSCHNANDPSIAPPWFHEAAERVAASIKRADLYIHPLAEENTWSRQHPHHFAKKHLTFADNEHRFDLYKQSRTRNSLKTLVGNRLFLEVDPTWDKWTTRLIVIHAQDIANINRIAQPKALCMQSACILWNVPLLCVNNQTSILLARSNRGKKMRSPHSHMFPKNTIQTHVYSHDSNDIEIVDGIPVTSQLRTLLDILARFPEPDYIVPGDALFRHLIHYDKEQRTYRKDNCDRVRVQFQELVARQHDRFPKRRVLRRFSLLHPASESPAESLARLFMHSLGIHNYQPQYPVMYRGAGVDVHPLSIEEQNSYDPYYDGPVRQIFVDIAIPDKRFALELDGAAKKLAGYSDIEADERTLWKQQEDQNNRDAILRWRFNEVVHLSWQRLWNWKSFVHAVRPALPNR